MFFSGAETPRVQRLSGREELFSVDRIAGPIKPVIRNAVVHEVLCVAISDWQPTVHQGKEKTNDHLLHRPSPKRTRMLQLRVAENEHSHPIQASPKERPPGGDVAVAKKQ